MTSLPVLELRRQQVLPDRLGVLVERFENAYLESQESLGAHILGQFLVEGRPDEFVWMRGFESLSARRDILADLSAQEPWLLEDAGFQAEESRLLEAVVPGDGIARPTRPRRPRGAFATNGSRFIAILYRLRDFRECAQFDTTLRQVLAETGVDPLASFSSFGGAEAGADPVHVVLVRFETAVGLETWLQAPPSGLALYLRASPETLILQPTARSLLR